MWLLQILPIQSHCLLAGIYRSIPMSQCELNPAAQILCHRHLLATLGQGSKQRQRLVRFAGLQRGICLRQRILVRHTVGRLGCAAIANAASSPAGSSKVRICNRITPLLDPSPLNPSPLHPSSLYLDRDALLQRLSVR